MVFQFSEKLIRKERIFCELLQENLYCFFWLEVQIYYPQAHEYPLFYILPLGDHLNHMDKRFLNSASIFSHVASFCMLRKHPKHFWLFYHFPLIFPVFELTKKHYNRQLCGNDLMISWNATEAIFIRLVKFSFNSYNS